MYEKNKFDLILINPNIHVKDDISLGYIAAYVGSKGFRAKVIDMASGRSLKSIAQAMNSSRPSLVGISAYQQTMANVISIAKIVKQMPDAKLIIGGPQAFAMPTEALHHLPDIDYICRGDGELVCHQLLEALYNNDCSNVEGISYRTEGEMLHTNTNPHVSDTLDVYPSPYISGVLQPRSSDEVVLFTSRGCTAHCAFCVTPRASGGRIRFHSIEHVIEEMKYLNSIGVMRFWIADPSFSTDRQRTYDLMNSIIANSITAAMWCQTSPNMVSDELLHIMKKAGVQTLAFGLESSSDNVRRKANKPADMNVLTNAIKMAQQRGIAVELLHMIGMPGSTVQSVLDTYDYIRKMDVPISGNSIGNRFQIYFGSAIAQAPERFGMHIDARQMKNYPPYLSPGTKYRTKELTRLDLNNLDLRWTAELSLTRIRENAEGIGRSFTVPDKTLVKMPWQQIEFVRDIFNYHSHTATATEYNRVLVHTDTRASDLAGHLDDVAFKSIWTFIGRETRIYLHRAFIKQFVAMHHNSSLYASVFAFSVSLSDWRLYRKQIEQMVRNLSRISRRPNPVSKYLTSSSCQIVCLIDISDESFYQSESVELLQAMQQYGAAFYPCFHSEEDNKSLMINRLYDLYGTEELGNKVVVVWGDEGVRTRIDSFYSDVSRYNLPIMQFISGETAYYGGTAGANETMDKCLYYGSASAP
jgi:anaerobic magnesium-protoporphyrin IX monomethyl ester cyclase